MSGGCSHAYDASTERFAGSRPNGGSARDLQCSGKGMGWFRAVVEDAAMREKAEALCRDTIEFLEAVRLGQHSVSD